VRDRLPQTLRSDARDNRELILEAARAAFGAEGPGVPMREIARRAGIGPATLYRRFPNKEILAAEALGDQMRKCYAVVEEAAADPDPWHGFRLVIEKLFELNAHNKGLDMAFTAAFPKAMNFAADRERALNLLAGLARRAKDAGRLRPDFVLDDLILMLMANRGLRTTSSATLVTASRRLAELAVQAFQASPLPSEKRLEMRPHAGRAPHRNSV
jgi:AcrR family transcriptional regulator